ncbi:hypothetical protein [Achromobacter phage Motura]|uniref:Uncharacterized protein n=1 Tax=Achromobacter phage Motura TaxID=2591403 RepID=A0A514CSH4_9CAUD|nr:hypothetical protein H1O15_gp011 [Achromobacter phage Motura]QDH83420.1 hypothetical protein [Achromobacter phage Motura]
MVPLLPIEVFMFGTITLASNGGLEVLPIFKNHLSGTHNPGRQNGTWVLETYDESAEVYLPQRDKHVTIWCNDPEHYFWTEYLQSQEATKDTQRAKLQKVARNLPGNINYAVLNTEGDHGSISLLTPEYNGAAIAVSVVISQRSAQLLWSISEDEDLIEKLRASDPRMYSIYRFPEVRGAMFINTLAVCSKWWKWMQTFEGNTLKCCNALEVMLCKER